MKNITLDAEASDLLNDNTIDYCASPYKLKDNFKLHCIVVEEHDTGDIIAFYNGPTYIFDGRPYEEEVEGKVYVLEDYEPVEHIHKPLDDFPKYVKENRIKKVIAHNGINYDLLVFKLYYGMDYTVGPDTWCGKPVEIEDTLVTSKTLNPDRFGGHSLDNLAKLAGGAQKIEFRKNIPQSQRFKHFAADMLYYNIFDVKSNTAVYKFLEKEKKGWKWDEAISLEKAVAEIITRQEHRGFWFDKDLAERNVKELDMLMEERRKKVEPLLPPRPATKKFLKEHTPPARQLKKNRDASSYLVSFVEKHGGKINGDVTEVELYGKKYPIPMPQEPILTEMKATIDNTTHIKNWLVGLGWEPTEYKMNDITLKSGTKIKRTEEELVKAIDRYVEETFASNFKKHRLEHLNLAKHSKEQVKRRMLRKAKERSMKVLTNPSFTVGQEKELCPDLSRVAEKFPYVKDIVEYLTYKHRRNSILGGGLEWDNEDEAEKGYLASIRSDGRIPTPADSCGAATSRMKHKVVSNIPRVTSLYGKNMRALFGVDTKNYAQIGYDFDSLEARIEAHYCWKYDKTKEYCKSLTLPKPFDVHTKMAKAISDVIGREFERGPAKSVKYGCLPVDNSEVLTEHGWMGYHELEEGMSVLSYSQGRYEWKPITKLWFYEDAEVIKMENSWFSIESTADHRWYGYKRSNEGAVSKNEEGFFTTAEVNTEVGIRHSAYYHNPESQITKEQAALVAWLLKVGYYNWVEPTGNPSSQGGLKQAVVGSINQDQKKYVKELEGVLKANGAEYTLDTKEGFNVYRLKSNWLRDFLDSVVGSREQKYAVDWVQWVLTLNQDALQEFLHHFWLADGHKGRTGSKHITQNVGNIADAIMLAANLTNHHVTYNHKTDKYIVMNLSKKVFTSGQRLKKSVSRKTDVFCLTNDNGTFVARQNGVITLTGNCTYGAQAPKVAQTIGCDLETGKLVFDTFWSAAAPLKALKEALTSYWKNVGRRKFILGIDGRKVPTRAEHAILNSLFQSAGVICAKRAMVYHDRLLKEEGLSVDFFKEDWRNKKYCQQLIAYHDEAQLEESKGNFTFKTFKTKEEALQFTESSDKVWSEPFEAKGKWFVGYSRAAELISKAVDLTTEHYKLNVPLSAGYIIGKNWRDCH